MRSLISNLASAKLVTAITPISTSITMTGGTGVKFPTITAGYTFNVVLEDATKNIEICKVTARAGDVLTVERGQESTVARAYSIGDRVSLRMTGAAFNSKADKDDKDTTGGYVGLTLFNINFKNVADTFISYFTNANTAARTYTFQDRSGTILDNTDYNALATLIAGKAAKGSNADITTLNAPELGAATATTQPVSDNSTKVATTAHVKAAVALAVPAGFICDFAGTAAPNGWMALPLVPTNGSRTTYAALFAAIGTTFGAGNGTTTFGLPYCPANYAALQANGNVGTFTTGEIKAHTHANILLGFAGQVSGSQAFAGSASGATGSTGGPANLAAGVYFLKCVKL